MIDVKNIRKQFGTQIILQDIDLSIREGEFFCLLGPSGCGKTTLLRMIAGFEQPDQGSIWLDGVDVTHTPAHNRATHMVFQNYAIFPHLTVGENVGFGLRKLKLSRAEANQRIEESLQTVGLGGFGNRQPHQLSGGQRQRVALARALILKPKVLLLDEPLSALDKKLREQMQVELRRLQQAVGITFVMVTHDQYEALSVSDRMAVMFGGKLAQLATPSHLYQYPESRQIADFLGGINFLTSENRTIVPPSDESQTAQLSATIPGFGAICRPLPSGKTLSNSTQADDFTVAIRPERLRILWPTAENQLPTADRMIEGTIVERHYFGEVTHILMAVAGQSQPILIAETNDFGSDNFNLGKKIHITCDDDAFIVVAN